MSNSPHIIVIGAGLIGLSTADSLLRRGAQVTVMDRRSGPGQGASFANSGMIHASQARPWHRPDLDRERLAALFDLGRRSRELIQARMGELGLQDAHRAPGCLQLFDSHYLGEQALDFYRAMQVPVEVATHGDWAYGRYALFFPDDFSGNAYDYACALERGLSARGAAFVYDADIDLSVLEADHIIIAAGIGSPALAEQLGLDIPIRPIIGHSLNFARPDGPLPDVPIIHDASHSALTVFEDHVRLSGTIGEDSPNALLDIWEEIAPDMISHLGPPIAAWSAARPVCDLGYPLVERLKDNIWINSGHGHMGWTLCAGSGDKLAQMMMG